MKLLDMYVALTAREITLAQAAAALGLTEKSLKIRIAKHGHRLPLVLSVLDKINENQITRDGAAEALEISVRTVNALMENWKVARPLADHAITSATAQVKWEVRKKFALDFIRGNLNLDQASEAAGVSTRQMRRWVSELISKHFGMVYKDLAELDSLKLRRVADAIRDAENLEEAARHTADQVARGLVTAREVGRKRAAAAKIARKSKERPA